MNMGNGDKPTGQEIKRNIHHKRRKMSKKKRRQRQYIRLVTSILVSIVCVICLAILFSDIKADDTRKQDNKTEESTRKSDSINNKNGKDDKKNNKEEQTTEKKQLVTLAGIEIPEYVLGLDSTVGNCGYSTADEERDENNRPKTVLRLQEKYGDKYNAMFLGENDKQVYLTYTITTEYYYEGKSILEILLDTLDKYNIKAAFFVTGEYVTSNPDKCREIIDRGHILGGHGFRHPDEAGMASYSPEEQAEDAIKMAEAIKAATGIDIKYYRPDSGRFSELSLALLYEMGFRNIFYSYAYPDWDVSNQPDEDETLEKWMNGLHNGEVMYLHAVSMTSINVLPRFIEKIEDRGFTIGTIE